jgi:cyclopropane fatty-acyl-phospholipid synthase-like methyltransferase
LPAIENGAKGSIGMSQQGPAAFWDQRYAEPGVSFGETPNAFLRSQAALFRKGQRVLVPGDGEGRNGVWLTELGMRVDSVDASPVGVANAQVLASARGVGINAIAADLTTWPWPVATYDAVVSIFLHFPAEVRFGMHARMANSLKPGGIVLLEAYTRRQREHHATGTVGGPQDVTMLFTADQLRTDFGALDIVTLEEVDVTLAEGTRHRGPSSVVRLIAQRR